MHHANDNVQLLLDDAGVVVERYEYEPYGERTVYISPGSNDPDCHAPTMMPQRVKVAGIEQPYAINETGFQGRPHCDLAGGIDHRTRMWNTRLDQWQQNDILEYIDGMNRRAGYHIMHAGVDPYGTNTAAIALPEAAAMYVAQGLPVANLARDFGLSMVAANALYNQAVRERDIRRAEAIRLQRCQEYTAKVVELCKGPLRPRGCRWPEMTCAELLVNEARFRACQAAREARDKACFLGGDDGHREQRAHMARGAERCKRIYGKQCTQRTACEDSVSNDIPSSA